MHGLTGTRAALVAMLLAAVAMFAAGGARAADVRTDYVPFVTDFGTPGTAAHPVVAPKPLPAPPRATGIDRADLGIAAALAALLAGSALVLARRANPRLPRTPRQHPQH